MSRKTDEDVKDVNLATVSKMMAASEVSIDCNWFTKAIKLFALMIAVSFNKASTKSLVHFKIQFDPTENRVNFTKKQ